MVNFVSFRELEFDHAFVTVSDYYGNPVLRWAPLGLPRVPRELTRCVFYLFEHDPAGGTGFLGPWGTGFIVARQSASLHSCFHFYAVSNRHVVNPSSTIRINTKSGGVKFIERDPSEWIFSDSDDLAATDVTDEIMGSGNLDDDVWCVSEYDFIDPQYYRTKVGIGDQTIMLGLFADHDGGGAKNLPVGRFGNLAALPDEAVPVRLSQSDRFVRPAFLNDMRSRSGFSGSPVWAWYSPYDQIKKGTGASQNAKLRLIGIHRGQFQEPARLLEPNRSTGSTSQVSIASSMTVVIPAWEITNLLNQNKLQEQRDSRDKRAERIKRSEEHAKLTHAQEGVPPVRMFLFPPPDYGLF